MGTPKMLLPWGKTSVLGHLIAQWQKLGSVQTCVVLASGSQPLAQEIGRLDFPPGNCIYNPAPQLGMFSSIRCAARWAGWRSDLTHWAIILGDQPHLPIDLLRALLLFAAAHPAKICQPGHQGRARHPVLLPRLAFDQLAHSTHGTLKGFLNDLSANVALCEMDDDALDLDLDTPADYEQAKRRFPGS